MNIRFAPDSVRLRISLAEGQALARDGALTQVVPLAQGEMTLDLSVQADQAQPVNFSFSDGKARTSLRESDFLALLADKPSRESCIRTPLQSTSDSPLEFVFEIDLLSRKEKKEGKA